MIDQLRAYLRIAIASAGRGLLIRLEAADVLGALLEGVVLLLLVPLVQLLAGGSAVHLPLLPVHVGLAAAAGALAVVVALRAAVQWWSAVTGSRIRLTTTHDLRLRALSGVLRADWSYLTRQRRSDVVHATTTEIERVDTALSLLLRLGVEVFVLVATAAVATVISPVVGGLAVLALVLAAVLARRSVRRTLHLGAEWTEHSTVFGATVTDSLSSLRLIRAHDAADAWSRLLRDADDAGRRVEQRYIETMAGARAGLGVLAVVVALVLVVVGRGLGLGVATLLTLAVVSTRMLSLTRGVLEALQAFAQLAPSLGNVSRIIRETAEHTVPVTPAPLHLPPGATPPAVELRSVTAGYDDPPAVADLTLHAPAGGLTVLVGPSGSGKSTLLDVLLGLLPPASGTLLVDGAPVDDARAWRARIGYVPQETVLVPATVRENLSWSTPHPLTDEELWAALEDACIADVVRRLPEGPDTTLTDFAQLSGGEQQRLSIARALARDPQVLLLDEATNALDEVTEQAVLSRLRARGCTIVMATHRPGVVRAADVVLDVRTGFRP